jgi:hypothetical protein
VDDPVRELLRRRDDLHRVVAAFDRADAPLRLRAGARHDVREPSPGDRLVRRRVRAGRSA